MKDLTKREVWGKVNELVFSSINSSLISILDNDFLCERDLLKKTFALIGLD